MACTFKKSISRTISAGGRTGSPRGVRAVRWLWASITRNLARETGVSGVTSSERG